MNCPPDDDWEEEPAEGESLSDEEKDKEDEEGEEEEKEDEEEDDGFFVGHGVLDKVRKYMCLVVAYQYEPYMDVGIKYR